MRRTVLIAEDDENDQFFVAREIKKIVPPVDVQFVEDGEQAIAYLTGTGQYSDRSRYPTPAVIFIDLKMPKLNGFELLEWLKRHDMLKSIPAIVVSASTLQTDIDKAYQLGANAYIVKPASAIDLQKLFKTTGEFFLGHAETPSLAISA